MDRSQRSRLTDSPRHRIDCNNIIRNHKIHHRENGTPGDVHFSVRPFFWRSGIFESYCGDTFDKVRAENDLMPGNAVCIVSVRVNGRLDDRSVFQRKDQYTVRDLIGTGQFGFVGENNQEHSVLIEIQPCVVQGVFTAGQGTDQFRTGGVSD